MVGVLSAVCRRITRRRPITLDHYDTNTDGDETNDQNLKECLSTLDLVSLGVGSCCGTGVYLSCGLVTMTAGGPGAIIAFIISGIASLLSGSCYAELASVCPKTSGSAYIYSYTAVGELIAYIIAWGLIAEYVIGAALASVALSTTIDSMLNFVMKDYLSTWGSVGGREYFDILAVLICVILTIVLISGVEFSASVNNILNLINLLVLLFFIGISIYYGNVANWTSTNRSSTWGVQVLAEIPTAYFAFIGFDGIASAGGEATNPSKSVPKSVIVSITICTVIYVLVSVCLSLIVPANQLPENTAMMDVFVIKNNYYAKYVISIGAVCGLFAAAFGSMFPLPRILCAMARDGLIHSHFGEICQKTKTPRSATLLTGILSISLAVTIDLNYLIELVLMGTLLAYILVAVSVLVLRYDTITNGYRPLEAMPITDEDDEMETEKSEYNTNNDTDISDNGHPNTIQCTESKQKQYSVKVLCRNCLPELLKLKCSTSVILSVILLIQVTLSVIIVLLIRRVLSLNAVILTILTILIVTLFTLITILSTLPQSISHQSFRVPIVPVLPLLVTFVNIYFITSLSLYSWIIFSIWMFIGFIIYFTFSIRSDVFKSRDFQTK